MRGEVAPGTWIMAFGESAIWLGYGAVLRDPALFVGGTCGVVFPAMLLGRLVVIPFYPLNDEMIRAISEIQLGRIRQRVEEHHKVPFNYGEDVIQLIASRCTDLATTPGHCQQSDRQRLAAGRTTPAGAD